MQFNLSKHSLVYVVVVLFALFIVMFSPLISYAQLPITQRDIDRVNRDEYYRDPDEPTVAASCSDDSVRALNSVFMIGDSITEGSVEQLEEMYRNNGASSIVDGISSRSLTEGDSELNGLGVLETRSADYADVEVVVIALGTNQGLTTGNIASAIDIVRESNEKAVIYWVNIGVANELREDPLPATEWNQTLLDNAEDDNFFVIDWAKVVAAQDNDFNIIEDDGLGVHPNAEGKNLFVRTIETGVLSQGSVSGCATTLTGSDNAEKVWNYMISQGLEPYQAAGFMGNMQAEAGFEPRRVEYPTPGDPWSSADFPDSLSDTVPPCFIQSNCRPGYGIVQWTAESRKNGLAAFSDEQGKLAGDLGLQMDYVWVEIQGGCCGLKDSFRERYGNVTVLDALRQTTTVEDATDLILRNYEIPANIDAAYVKRVGFARAWLARFDSGGD